MDKLVKTLGINSLSKSQVSRMAADLDHIVEDFRHRPLDEAGPFSESLADQRLGDLETLRDREGVRLPRLWRLGVH